MKNVIVTTSGRPSVEIVIYAKKVADLIGVPFVERKKRSVNNVMKESGSDAIVVGADGLKAHRRGSSHVFFFHPNSAMFRAKRWLKSGEDPLVEACKLKPGDTVVDATLGLGSDAILASLAVGDKGAVIGLDASPIISFLVTRGLKDYNSGVQYIDDALRRIMVISADNRDWLRNAPEKSVDIVYFDPMFEEAVTGADGFDSIRPFTYTELLTEEVIKEAKRVARKRVVLKDHFRSKRFEELGFHVRVRPSATYHFGTIELNEEMG
ncbi:MULTISPECIES: class I SAM-dependent methyltransferase [Bacillaceae]|uniref:Class I SAM-dependent methyltransferase n=1 Tax=Evansella alkalicola TaxID=745819 RepID=A0ABS6JVQ0_9BACI|nr:MULTISPECIES: class I SAM-dependent methyltransferase [Bacillaceae]MBU9722660.1 class I SAM-dependent methyltransferase [Bacillus alkalicola]